MQKSRCLWLKAGDRNTAFFHKQAEARKNYKSVQEIHTLGQVIQDFDEIKMEATRHFKSIYTAETDNTLPNAAIMELVPRLIKSKDNNALMQRITLEELKVVLENMEEDKAPGPHGFNAKFVKEGSSKACAN